MPGRRVPARILERGRVTIPKDVRDDLGLEHGDRVWLEVEPVEGNPDENWLLGD